MTTDDHTHPSPAHKAGCPVCNPDKTVPELNDAYRASNERSLLDRAVDTMAALHRAIEPMEDDPELAGRVPPAAMRAFVDALADIDRERAPRPVQTEVCPVCRTVHDKPLCPAPETVPELNDAYRASKPLCKHDWVGDDDCAYCRIDCLRAALIEAREYILDNGDERTMAPVVQRIDDAAYDLRQPVETKAPRGEERILRAGISHAIGELYKEVDEYDDESGNPPRELVFIRQLAAHLNGTLLEADQFSEKTEAEHPDTRRLRWLANTVLFCDYGDNSAKQIGWRVYEFIAPLMYGASINEAIDAAMPPKEQPPRRRSAGDVKTSSDSARLDWALRNVSGLEWRRLGIEYSAGMTRDDLDKRIALDVNGDA